ncbi:MAG TPA: hypothetical protein VE553_09630, partial [Candidatus Binatia bacterium]|nr:hypothetical protein [Candidatus Binatia bacterium]
MSGPQRAWAYTRHELLYICWAVMDVSLIAPVGLLLMPWTYFWPLPALIVWLVLVMLIPFNLSRLLSIADVEVVQQRRIIVVAFVLALIFAVRTLLYEPTSLLDPTWLSDLVDHFFNLPGLLWQRDLALFALLAVLWWRGLGLAKRQVAVDEVGFRLRLGGLLLAPLVIGLSLVPAAGSALPLVMLFFLAALVAVALTRAEEVARQGTGANYPMSP